MSQTADPKLIAFASDRRASYRALIPVAGMADPVAGVKSMHIAAADPSRDIPLRVYMPVGAEGRALPIVLFAHGGGFVSGDWDTHDVMTRALANEASAVVVSVGYRLAPEHPFPAGLEDVYAVLLWLAENGGQIGGDAGRIAVVGDSAGGNLATAATILARDRDGPAVAAQWLMYPTVSNRLDTQSWKAFGDANFPTRELMAGIAASYVPADRSPDEPLIAPLFANLEGLPPTLIQVGQFDPLRDEDLAYADALHKAGVDVEAWVYPGQAHGFTQFFKDRQNNAWGEAAIKAGAAFLAARLHR